MFTVEYGTDNLNNLNKQINNGITTVGDDILARIIIVENGGIEAQDLENLIQSMGHEVVAIESRSSDAVKRTQKLMPDLVLMDIILKGIGDGVDAAQEIKKLDIPVIYLTAHSDEVTVKRAMKTEPYGYLLKPFNVMELKLAIELALYRKKVERMKETGTCDIQLDTTTK